ncbi:MAG: hemin receptor [Hyphomicrobiaceae bacterium]|nr:hemin receptor [Hyphomicrobiaceae bacterium]MCC0007546.1 hemin receptor [Hyphomicrobiaceae bacterium]
MTPEQVKLVQESFKKVEPIADKAADLFYGRLFEIAPQVRPLFPSDMSQQKMKLMSMIGTAVNNLHQVEKIIPAVQDLGRKHVAYGVTGEHYKPVGEALIWTLEKGLGDAFTPEVKTAWVTTYQTLEKVMTDAAGEVVPAAALKEKKGFFARMFG